MVIEFLTGMMAMSVLIGFLLLTDNHQRPAKPLVDEYTILLLIAMSLICGWRGSSEILTLAGINQEWRYYSPSLFVLGCGLGLWRSWPRLLNKRPARCLEQPPQPSSARLESE
jgi:hypothetical protein